MVEQRVTDEQLTDLERLAGAATGGPWAAHDLSDEKVDSENRRGWWWVWREANLPHFGGVLEVNDRGEPHGAVGEALITDGRDGEQERADAEFIAAAREALPALIADLRESRAREAELGAAFQSATAAHVEWEDKARTVEAERDGLQQRIDKALEWCSKTNPSPETNGDLFADLRAVLSGTDETP